MTRSSTRGYAFVILAACLWGTLGLFFRVLHNTYGLPALTLAFLRAGLGTVIALGAMLIIQPRALRLPRRALAFFALYGLIGIAAFYWVYAQAILLTNVATAAVLLYTAPAFVTLIAWRAWGEPIDRHKMIALTLAFGGCVLVADAYDPTQLSLNLVGIALGIGAGFAYALYTVLGKIAMRQYSPSVALTYELIFGTFFLLPLQTADGFAPLAQPVTWIFLVGLALGPTLGAAWLFNAGLQRVPASNASIIATIEPVVASVLAFVLLNERLEILQILGGGMVIAGAIYLSAGQKKSAS